jgi:hypothetical protein
MSAGDVSAVGMGWAVGYKQTSSTGLVYHRELRLVITTDLESINRIFSS